MSVGSISFWQQDQNYWAKAQKNDNDQTLSSAVINQMFSATTTVSSGLSSLANQTALSRVNSALTAAIQNALQGTTGSSAASTSSSSSGSSSSSSASTSSTPPPPSAPASGTGTVPLTTGTSLFTLGILKGGTISVGDGTNVTAYKSTGSDTVGDLINAINAPGYGKADVTAGLNSSGQLVLTAKSTSDSVVVTGTYAGNIGFGPANDTFLPPAAPAASTATSNSSASSTGAASGSSSTTSSSTATSTATKASGIPNNSALALLSGGTAELLLASSGLTGNILDLLA